MERLLASSQHPKLAPVFGLRYLEEETAEANSVVGCLLPEPIDRGGGGGGYTPTSYVTNCDYQDAD